MKRNKPGVMPEITRDTYKNVKKFDRQQFTEFCTDLYKFGYMDGRASVPGIDADKICEVIAATKGIGPKKLAEIKANIDAAFGEKENDTDKKGAKA